MSENLKLHVGERIRRARKEARLTQGELAERVQKETTTISNAERGKTAISLETLGSIAEQLGIEPTFFLKGYTSGRAKAGSLASIHQELDLVVSRLDAQELNLLINLARAVERSGK